jgi:tRNA pseudouridine38-40 synthase
MLVGAHDFSAFRSKECQSPSALRKVHMVSVARDGDYVWVEICANAFLHHMVRNIVGTLLEVGCGDAPGAFVAEVLAGRDRSRAGITAPAAGLYLWAVEYPAGHAIASGPALKLPSPV